MRPLSIPIAQEFFCSRQPVVLLASKLSYGTVSGGAVQQPEGTLVDDRGGSAVNVFARGLGAGPAAAECAGHALEFYKTR